jgi:hypothetical protein
MKTKVEINGYEIVIEEKDGLISVSATKDEEVIEEFEIETEEGQGNNEDSEEVQDFDSFGQDEEDEDFESEEDEDFESEEDENEVKLESFQSFINKRK